MATRNRRSPEQITALNSLVKKALGRSRSGRSMTDIEDKVNVALGEAKNAEATGLSSASRVQLRQSLVAIDATTEGKTRAAVWLADGVEFKAAA